MTTKNYYAVLPVLTASLLIPQLLFWWLAPLAAIARLAIYLGVTLITSAVIATLFVSYWKCGLRKTAGLAVASGILEITTIIECAVMLAVNATVRSAIYALAITGLIHLMVLIPMVCSAFKPERAVVAALDGAAEGAVPVAAAPAPSNHPPIPAHDSRLRPGNGHKALPPRNR